MTKGTGKTKKKARDSAEWLSMRIDATALRTGRMCPDIYRAEPQEQASSSIAKDGTLRPTRGPLRDANVTVFERDEDTGNSGAAIGGNERLNVVCSLPRSQFSDLQSVLLAGRLSKVDMLFEDLRRGKGVLRSIEFSTSPVPSEIDEDDYDAKRL